MVVDGPEVTRSAVLQRLRSVFNQQFQFMALLDPDGRILDVNDMALTATGVRWGRVANRTFERAALLAASTTVRLFYN